MQPHTAEVEARSIADPPQKSTGKVRLLSLARLDGRTVAAKRARELIEAIETDLGGSDRLTEGCRQLVQRAAVLGTYVESCEAEWLAGKPVALSDYLAAINAQRRVLATIGLQRIPREVPSLVEHLANLRERTPPTAAPDIEAEAADAGEDAPP